MMSDAELERRRAKSLSAMAERRAKMAEFFEQITKICELTPAEFGPFYGQIAERSIVPGEWIDEAPFVGGLWSWIMRVGAYVQWDYGKAIDTKWRRDLAKSLTAERKGLGSGMFDVPFAFASRLLDDWKTPLELRGREEHAQAARDAALELMEIVGEARARLRQWELDHGDLFLEIEALGQASGNTLKAAPLKRMVWELGELWELCPAAGTRGPAPAGHSKRRVAFVCMVLEHVGMGTVSDSSIEDYLPPRNARADAHKRDD